MVHITSRKATATKARTSATKSQLAERSRRSVGSPRSAALPKNREVSGAQRDEADYRAAGFKQKVAQVRIAMRNERLTDFEHGSRANEKSPQ